MTSKRFLLLLLQCPMLLLASIASTAATEEGGGGGGPLKTYLVVVRRPDGMPAAEEEEELNSRHISLIASVCNTTDPASRLIYSYSHVVSGFSAWLTEQEVARMASHSWFVDAFPDKNYKLMVGNTPQLMDSPER